jgi:outer membrane protein
MIAPAVAQCRQGVSPAHFPRAWTAVPRTVAASFAAAVALCALAAPASAQPAEPAASERSSWALGLGVNSRQKAYPGVDRDNRVLPFVLFENAYVRVFGPGVEVKLPSLRSSGSQRLDLGIVGQYDGNGYEPGDAPALAGMAERDSGFWIGAKATWRNDLVDISLQWLGDASGNSKGQRIGLELQRTWAWGGKLLLTPRVAARWLDSRYVDYYYGVRPAEATASRAAYEGKSGVNTEIGLRALYRLDAANSVVFDVGVTRLATEIRRSPIVGRSSENSLTVGYLHHF